MVGITFGWFTMLVSVFGALSVILKALIGLFSLFFFYLRFFFTSLRSFLASFCHYLALAKSMQSLATNDSVQVECRIRGVLWIYSNATVSPSPPTSAMGNTNASPT